jgi:hypothetical protein
MADSISSSPRRKKEDDLDQRQTPNKRVPAWKLREQMKSQQPQQSRTSGLSQGPVSGGPLSKASKNPLGAMDPSLPPAFRAAFKSQRKKEVDDFMSMASVHSSSSRTQLSTVMTATPTSNDSDDSGLDDSESTFDGHDSFASLGEDDDDDEAYREGRNQIAKQTVECSRPTTPRGLKSNDLRFRKGGVHGTPLNFIPE